MTRSLLDGYNAKDKAMLAFMACTVALGGFAMYKVFEQAMKEKNHVAR